jgi:hypothetical protein
MPSRRALLLGLLLLFTSGTLSAEDPKAVEFFEAKIRPVLVEHCYKCHSEQALTAGKLRGGFKLDTRVGMRKGGDSGPGVVPGKPADSLLVKSLKYDGDVQMPPAGKLPAAVIADFEKWVSDGAIDPREAVAAPAEATTTDIEKGRQFWAFQPPKPQPVPAVADPKVEIRTFIDAFIHAKWAEKGLAPAPPADKRTLLRRAAFGLTGLPPTPHETDVFVADASPDAWAKAVDRLLASPHYGERWGRHWLDVARYSEDQAHTFQVRLKTQAWRYRDWVIRAFNQDMPYDRFVKLQIAGDLLPDAPADKFDRFAGLGFLGLGAEYYRDGGCGPKADADELDDRVDTVSRGFLGLTAACARCHDHKFDPIPTRDYYALAGIYAGTKLTDEPLAPPDVVKAFADAKAKVKEAEDRLKKAKDEQKKASDKKAPADELKPLEARVKELTDEVAKRKKEVPPPPDAVHVLSGNGAGMRVLVRGNPAAPGEDAPKGFFQVLPSLGRPGKTYGRLELANDIASAGNPLTARVIVNRVWAWHFGRGLVATPSNFGALGDRPSHPELLDHLAVEFVKHGWSLKWLHRQILTSSVYQLSGEPAAANDRVDAANMYLWRANRRRLDVESWRDSLLFVSGNLDAKPSGPTFDLKDPTARRRTVYAKVSRHELDGLLRLFDFPDANVTADQRTVTTVPQQQLFALNSEFMVGQAKEFAARVEKHGQSDTERIAAAYRLAFQRPPDPAEAELAERFLTLPANPKDRLTRWQQYAQALLASNEMLYVD